MILPVVFYTFIAFTVIQIIYYISFSSSLFNKTNTTPSTDFIPISVVIFAKNCAAALQKNLPLILAQNYARFEIVLINNASTDNTLEVIEKFKAKNDNIKILDVANNETFWGNKKYPLTLGIKAAKHEHLLFTSAHAEPVSEFWIAEMSKQFIGKKTITLGYTTYKNKNTLGNFLIRFHNLITALQCFSFAKFGSPFMAFGENFGYQKKTFFKVKGFINHIKLKYGENDLFLKDAANKNNISFTITKNSIIEKDTPKSFNNWFQQQRKKRILKKQYKLKHRFLISFFTVSKLLFYAFATFLFFFYPWLIMLPIVLTYFLVQFIIVGMAAKKLKEPYLIFVLPFLEIGLLLIQISIFSANLISKPNHWK
ncbi:glycosyltransferase [Polaribacter sp. R77954]|uniref:glycosyltransferase n=1 Tax=Polaribacter sp. R77954 TaxID=3093870 RepID=UPI0037CC49B3